MNTNHDSLDFYKLYLLRKRHALQVWLIIGEQRGKITATFFGKGRGRDYKLLQLSRMKLDKHLKLRVDLVYWGLRSETDHSVAEKQQVASLDV